MTLGQFHSALLDNFVIVSVDAQYRRPVGPAVAYMFAGPEFRYHFNLRDENEMTMASFLNNLNFIGVNVAGGAGLINGVGRMRVTADVKYADRRHIMNCGENVRSLRVPIGLK